MKPDRWRKIDELFDAALERPPKDRAAFLDQACGSDRELRREVEKMLAFDQQAEDFIQTDVFNAAAKLITKPNDNVCKKIRRVHFQLDRRRQIYSGRRARGALPHRRSARPRRHGRGLSRRRSQTQTISRTQVSARVTYGKRRRPRALLSRSQRLAADLAPPRLSCLRRRRISGTTFHLDGICARRRTLVVAKAHRPFATRQGHRRRATTLRRSRSRSRTRRTASRSETGEHHARRAW